MWAVGLRVTVVAAESPARHIIGSQTDSQFTLLLIIDQLTTSTHIEYYAKHAPVIDFTSVRL